MSMIHELLVDDDILKGLPDMTTPPVQAQIGAKRCNGKQCFGKPFQHFK